jgi:pilus assembly protein CpaE
MTAGVASTDVKSAALLLASLQQTGLVQSVLEWGLPAAQAPDSADAVPDVVLVELARDPQASLAFAAQLYRIRPSVCIIACSTLQQPSPELLMQAMRSGVREFLPQPVDPLALRETLGRLLKERPLEESTAEKLIVIMGAKGGVGTTTVAVNLGVQLAQVTQKRVALLDFGRPLGHVSLLLDLQARFALRDAVENLDRLDNHFFAELLTTHKSGLQVLAGASHPDVWQGTSIAALARVINVAQSSADFVVADAGSFLSSEWAPALQLARLIIAVAETDVPALWSLERQLGMMRSAGLDPERFRIIINRWHRGDEEALEAFEKKVKQPIFARLPNDFRQVSEAVNLGTALSRSSSDPLVSKFRKLAFECAGVQQHEPEGKRGALLGLFTFSAKS